MQIVWSMLLATHAALAVMWLWLMPAGFPSGSTAFVVNQVAPWIVLVWMVVALVARAAKGDVLVPPLLLGVAAFWIGAGASSHIAFPESSGALWLLALAGGLVLTILWFREQWPRVERRWLVPLFVMPALWAGWAAPLTQRAPDATTHPLATALPDAPTTGADTKIVRFGKDAQLRPGEGRLVVKRGEHLLTVQPLLGFETRSPDRGPVSMAPPRETPIEARRLVGLTHDAARWTMRYRDEAAVLTAQSRDGAVELDATTLLPADVFTHLNSLFELTLRGHKKLALRFSPVPNLRVDVPAFTEPARFAYVDAQGIFHLAQAKAFNKGPFTELGKGALKPDEPLTIQLYDGDALIFTVRVDDWARQASTALSPTAGWGVPVNAIQFMRASDAADAPALVTATLAATGIGRGEASVGHAAGAYRNRMRIETK